MSFSNVLILKPSASPVWLPCEGQGVSPNSPPTPRVWDESLNPRGVVSPPTPSMWGEPPDSQGVG